VLRKFMTVSLGALLASEQTARIANRGDELLDPCVLTKQSGVAGHVGKGGVVIDSLDSRILATSMIELLRDIGRLNSMSQNARNVVATEVNWDSVAQKMIRALKVYP
jgi:hypothetical protein